MLYTNSDGIVIQYEWSDKSTDRDISVLSSQELESINMAILLGSNHGSVTHRYLCEYDIIQDEYDKILDTCVTEYTVDMIWQII